MKLTKIQTLFMCMFIIILLITILCQVRIYIENNKVSNRTLYYYGNELSFDEKTMESISKENIGCYLNNYIIQNYYSMNFDLLLGYKPLDNEAVITKKYCQDTITTDNLGSTKVVDKCTKEVLNNHITINDKELKLVGIINARVIVPNIYLNLKKENIKNDTDTIFVSPNTLNAICGTNNDYYFKIIFKSYQDLLNFDALNNAAFVESDVFIRDYMNVLYFCLVILMIGNIAIAWIRRRKDGINQCQ